MKEALELSPSQRLPAVIIPAFQPERAGLRELLWALLAQPVTHIYLIDDGCTPPLTLELATSAASRITLLRHAANLGKGQALKTGINAYLLDAESGRLSAPGVVTVDADGQHAPEDVVAVATRLVQEPSAIALGVREFSRRGVPWRSVLGNVMTRLVFRVVAGRALRDTQTGLRAIPNRYLPAVLSLQGVRYEFELEMLIDAIQKGIEIDEVPIRTVYIDGNSSSHFNPVLDSVRVYLVFVRFSFASLATFALDTTVFLFMASLGSSLLGSTLAARSVAGVFNFAVNKLLVFRSRTSRVATEALRYLMAVAFLGAISYWAILRLSSLGVPVGIAKVSVELLLFATSFAIQRAFVFVTRKGRP